MGVQYVDTLSPLETGSSMKTIIGWLQKKDPRIDTNNIGLYRWKKPILLVSIRGSFFWSHPFVVFSSAISYLEILMSKTAGFFHLFVSFPERSSLEPMCTKTNLIDHIIL